MSVQGDWTATSDLPKRDVMNDPATMTEASPALPQTNPVSGWRKLAAFVSPVISVAILGGALWQVHLLDWNRLLHLIPTSPLIWLVFGLNYLSGPLGDWVIFRKLWRIPLEGLFPLIKKMIGNQILLSYVGEVYFYDWARRHVKIEGSPFGAVKDVAILSAIAGYAMTLVMLALAFPLLSRLGFGFDGRVLWSSIALMLGTGLIITAFRNRLLSLSRGELWWVFCVHMLRLLVNSALMILLWCLMLPSVPVTTWVTLWTAQLLFTRLPLIVNPQLAFVGARALLGGPTDQTQELLTVLALFSTAIHIVVYIGMLLLDLVQKERNA
jgi:hypothetical protein